jgi:hypothetical protein
MDLCPVLGAFLLLCLPRDPWGQCGETVEERIQKESGAQTGQERECTGAWLKEHGDLRVGGRHSSDQGVTGVREPQGHWVLPGLL